MAISCIRLAVHDSTVHGFWSHQLSAWMQSTSMILVQAGQHVDIELVIHYQMLSTPHPKHKAEPAKATKLPSVSSCLAHSSGHPQQSLTASSASFKELWPCANRVCFVACRPCLLKQHKCSCCVACCLPTMHGMLGSSLQLPACRNT